MVSNFIKMNIFQSFRLSVLHTDHCHYKPKWTKREGAQVRSYTLNDSYPNQFLIEPDWALVRKQIDIMQIWTYHISIEAVDIVHVKFKRWFLADPGLIGLIST